MLFFINKNMLRVLLLVCLIAISSIMAYSVSSLVSAVPKSQYCVVLDAGHGGIDGGSRGKSGVYERDLNLAVTKKIKKLLNTLGVDVIETRKTEDGLYETFVHGFKQKDMKERRKIIQNSNAQLVVSVHMNYFGDSKARGAQVFYKPNSEISKGLAENMQKLFVNNLVEARKTPSKGDFFILTCTDKPGVLVECGYLSNSEEETLLLSEEYQNKLAYQIFCGIVSFFDIKMTENN